MTRFELIALSLLGGLAIALVVNGGRTPPAPDWPHYLPERNR